MADAFPARSRRRLAGYGVVILALTSLGCGGAAPGSISGTVKLDGKPLEGGTVVFHCDQGRTVLRASIDADGRYTIPKAPAGPATIAVFGQEALSSRPVAMEGGAPEIKDAFKKGLNDLAPMSRKRVWVPPRYEKPETSGLKYTVESREQTHDLGLEKRAGD
jgi:hypothetical protein